MKFEELQELETKLMDYIFTYLVIPFICILILGLIIGLPIFIYNVWQDSINEDKQLQELTNQAKESGDVLVAETWFKYVSRYCPKPPHTYYIWEPHSAIYLRKKTSKDENY